MKAMYGQDHIELIRAIGGFTIDPMDDKISVVQIRNAINIGAISASFVLDLLRHFSISPVYSTAVPGSLSLMTASVLATCMRDYEHHFRTQASPQHAPPPVPLSRWQSFIPRARPPEPPCNCPAWLLLDAWGGHQAGCQYHAWLKVERAYANMKESFSRPVTGGVEL